MNEFEVEYLIVGGYAVMKYTEPRYTKDLDVWVHNSPPNAVRVYHALAQFGAPLKHDGVTLDTFTKDTVVYQIGVAPVRIDISTHIDGVTFDTAWRNRVRDSIFGVPVQFLSLSDLITNKQSAGRSTDAEDVKALEREAKKKA
ncbi:MAG: nucleotidyltransferase [Candidatus Solibacter sp.]|nr:nucleotidyltransferase [Candidatus Solibacter sp.]